MADMQLPILNQGQGEVLQESRYSGSGSSLGPLHVNRQNESLKVAAFSCF